MKMGCNNCSCKIYPRLSEQTFDTSHNYDLMVIGESPTAIETRKHVVMSGHGAGVLKETMKAVGLPTDTNKVYYTTAIKCAVPKKKGQKLPKDASIHCREQLLEEIKKVQPQIILVCGAVALATLTGDSTLKVTEEYGRVREYDFLPKRYLSHGSSVLKADSIKVIPIMNPGVLLHKPGDYKPFLTMIQLASTIYKGGSTVDTGETRWTVCDTQEKCEQLWRKMVKEKIEWCAMDIETTGLDYRTAEFLVAGICFEKNHAYVIPREMSHLLHNFIDNPPWKTIWQHGKYDKKVAWRRGLGDIRIDGDTMYQHYVLDETSAHDLGYLSKVFLNAEEYKYKMNQNWKSVTVESYPEFFEALCERVAVDCDYQLQLFHKFNEILLKPENTGLQKLYNDFLIPAANFLSRVEQNGLLVDTDYLQTMDTDYKKLLAEILDDIGRLAEPFWDPEAYMIQADAKSAPSKFNPGSPKQMAWMVFDRLKLRPRIKKGRSTAKEILDSIEDAPMLIKKVREYRSVQKEHSTYVIGLLNAKDEDGKVRSTFNLHVTATGRLSSKEPNVQNQPSANGVGNIRKAFIAEPGRLLAEIDYSGAELRWLAFLSKCPVLGEVFMQGRNLHDETAKALFGEHYDKKQKMRAKAVNFGIPYGISAPSIADEHNITVAEAQEMIDGWNAKYYGAAEYLEWCAEQVKQGNYLETPFGRRRRFGLVSPASLHALQNEAKNFPIQSSSSDLLLDCSLIMEDTLKKEYSTLILNLIHDSDLLSIPADKKTLMAVGEYANRIMTQRPIERFNCPIPFKTDFEIGFNWGELVAFNWATGNIEIENKDDTITVIDFDDWHKQKMEEMA
jgi:DNA polymerase-1